MSGQPLLAGIHRRLKDSDTSWEDRIRLARFAWCSSQCFLPNKQQVLIDWVCNALANSKKCQVPDDVVATLWQYLHDVLHSKQLQQEEDISSAVSVKDYIYPVLCDALDVDGSNVTIATACSHVILHSASLSRSLTAKYDAMLGMLSSFMRLVTKYLQSRNGNHMHADAQNGCLDTAGACLQILLKKFSIAHRQRQIQTQRKAFAAVYEILLIPSLHLYTCDKVHPGIRIQIADLIGTGLFNKEMCEAYKRYLINTESRPLDGKDKYLEPQLKDIANLMDFLKEQATNSDACDKDGASIVVRGIPVLYTVFKAAYKPSADVMFAMCKKLCGIMGITVNQEDSGISSDTTLCDWHHMLPALEQMLHIVCTSKTYTIAADNSSGKLQYTWLHHLLKVILTNGDRSCVSFYKCLHTLLDLNHLIIEEELTRIWNVSLVHVSKSDIDNHKADTLGETRTEFLGALMQTYVKLRQFDKLLECLLASYRNDNDDVLSDTPVTLNPGFVNRFCKCIQALPPGLTLDLWKLFQDDLVNSYVSHLSELFSTASPKKKRKRMESSVPVTPIGRGLELAAVTYHLFLMAARFIDLSVTVVVMDRLETLIEQTQSKLLRPLHEACCQQQGTQINEHLLFSTLLLSYTMGELHLVLLQHTKYGHKHTKYDEGDMETGGEPAIPDNVAMLKTLPHLRDVLEFKPDDMEEKGLEEDILARFGKQRSGKRTRITHLVHLLRSQQAKAIILHLPNNDTTQAVMQRLSDSIFASDVRIEENDALSLWDGQICNISDCNYAIAHLHFLTQTSSIWLPYTSSTNHHRVASLFVQAFNSNTDQQATISPGDMTLREVARSFMSSDVCLESKDLQSALLVAGLTCVADLLASPIRSPKKRKKTDRASSSSPSSMAYTCGQLLSMLSGVAGDNKDVNWELLENVGKRYSDLLQSKASSEDLSSTKIAECVRTVDNVLKVLHQLPLSYLLPSNQDRCILGLVIMDSLIATWLLDYAECSNHLMETLIVCRKLEIEILQAMKSTGILKCINVSTMLADGIDKHSIIGKYLLETDNPQQTQVKRNYLELDDITQRLALQWIQKVGDRSTHEGSVLEDITALVQTKLSSMNDIMMKSPSADHLYKSIPLLSTAYNIIQMNSGARDQEVKGQAKFMMSVSGYLQSVLASSLPLLQCEDSVDPLLVGCLAKTATGFMMLQKLMNINEGKASVEGSIDSSSIAMETDDAAAAMTTLKKKSKRGSKLSDADTWRGVLQPVLTVVLRHLDNGARMRSKQDREGDPSEGVTTGNTKTYVLPVCLEYLKAVCDFKVSHGEVVGRDEVDRVWKSICGLLWLTEDSDLKDCLFATASHVLVSMETEQFCQALDKNVRDLGAIKLHPDSVASFKALVLIWQVLPDCQLSTEKHRLLEQCVPQVLTSLQCLLVETVVDWSTEGDLAVNILTALTAMVTCDKKLLEPKQAMQILQASLTIEFTSVPDGLFPAVFGTLYLMLRSILQAFPQAVLHCMAAFVACLRHMLSGVMHRGHQKSSGNTRSIDDQDLFCCAENMERLLTQMSSHKREVSKSVIVLISGYISELQKGTLLPFVKKALVVGVYNLVDICDEKALALMQSTLPLNLKEIYTEFYSDYKKYYKYQGKV